MGAGSPSSTKVPLKGSPGMQWSAGLCAPEPRSQNSSPHGTTFSSAQEEAPLSDPTTAESPDTVRRAGSHPPWRLTTACAAGRWHCGLKYRPSLQEPAGHRLLGPLGAHWAPPPQTRHCGVLQITVISLLWNVPPCQAPNTIAAEIFTSGEARSPTEEGGRARV